MRVCVVTSTAAAAEPRAPRHALAAKKAFPRAEVTFVDFSPAGRERYPDPTRLSGTNIRRLTVTFPTRESGAVALVARKLWSRLAQIRFAIAGTVSEAVFGTRTQGLTRELQRMSADVYIAHNIETLLPAIKAAAGKASVVFDCMEYYSDMGDSQSPLEARAARAAESSWLRTCALVLASSDNLADELASQYGIPRPTPSYNVPATLHSLPAKRTDGALNLYWRNSVIGFGQRGLDDAFIALSKLPSDIRLFVQGRLPEAGAGPLVERATSLGIKDRITVLPAYSPDEAVLQAAQFDVGLCLERKGPKNHELTVSNKMFDYHMAGLAVISSNLPALQRVIASSAGGLLYEPGDPISLADAIHRLYSSPETLAEMQRNARRYALEGANLECEIQRLSDRLAEAIAKHAKRASPQ